MNEKFMKRAIELAQKGSGFVNPNPLVGAVIVKDNKVIGEGYHQYFGGAHAEINALKSAAESVKGATMYVSLEPCSHYGKTPPCVNAIIENNISKVVVAMIDPNPKVAGRGVKILREHGIHVTTGVMENEAKKLNEVFIKYIQTKLPFCILKTAMTLDGKIATHIGDSKWISNDKSRQHVHEIRHKVSSIMVGIGTVLKDDPRLNTRLEGGRDPIRIIVDTNARIPLTSKALNVKSDTRTIVATTEKADKDNLEAIKQIGAQVIVTPLKNNRVDLRYFLKKLGEIGIDSVLIEGGSTLNFSMLQEGLVDKVMSFISPKIVGGEGSKTPVGGEGIKYIRDCINLKDINVRAFDEDILIEGYIRKEDC